jgi:hypothetical protein
VETEEKQTGKVNTIRNSRARHMGSCNGKGSHRQKFKIVTIEDLDLVTESDVLTAGEEGVA